jgi:hypothetical protein
VTTGAVDIGPFYSMQYSVLGTSLEQSTLGFIALNTASSRAQSRDIVAQVSPSVAGQVKIHSRLCSRRPSVNDELIARTVNAGDEYEMLHMMNRENSARAVLEPSEGCAAAHNMRYDPTTVDSDSYHINRSCDDSSSVVP